MTTQLRPSYGTILHHLAHADERGRLRVRHAYRAAGGVTQPLCGAGGQPVEAGRWSERRPGLTARERETVECAQCRSAVAALVRRLERVE